MFRNLKILIALLLMAGLALVAVKTVKKKKAALERLSPPQVSPLPVEVVRVKVGPLLVTEHYLGEIRPVLSARLSSRITGYLLEVRKYEGDPVKKGEVLARIDDRKIRAQMGALSAQISAAETEFLTRKHIYERDRTLFENQAISREAYELSKAAFENAKARLAALKKELSAVKSDLAYTMIQAPFSGLVSHRFREPGELVLPGIPILEIEAPEEGYRIFVRVPQRKAAYIKEGSKAVLSEGRRRLSVSVFRVHPAVSENGLATVEIRVAERPFGLPSGAKVGVDLVMKEVQGAIVPLKSLLETTEKTYVFLAKTEEGDLASVRSVPVMVLGRNGNLVAVSGRISEGDWVIVAEESTLLRLHEGMKVQVTEKAK
ncbi:efflux RND transporter periplasmic adaptor subunit [Thermosulfurimonas dismutans]|uniref:RND efflux system, membrane fusion protein CmeA n=1 Tax=Thermosulfurimonas dismutans TaxID=999894 RepID=A0A179D439_9BACT|nr:efflux RND transporter periplasmic adaptor subunit [Thermosulfurimonas dismutans]OAQ20806.1 RND efflux system, membrane fusion protein CmeA [Thermosulfurimonas dismutans]